MAEQRVVALLGVGLVPTDTPILCGDDLGVLRGDGIFEAIHVRGGRPWLLDEHLARLDHSARRLDLALPPREALADLIDLACSAWPDDVEGMARLVCTRGRDGGDRSPTVYAMVSEIGAGHLLARRDGVSVLTATRGTPAGAHHDAPWLLGGAKTLSYAMNMACLRWAAAAGADDMLWVSTDGYALEGPISTLLWLEGDVLYTVPPAQTGILAGTTARFLLDHTEQLGWRAGERMVRPDEVVAADGAWLASSGRGLAEIRSLDGVGREPSGATRAMQRLVGFEAP